MPERENAGEQGVRAPAAKTANEQLAALKATRSDAARRGWATKRAKVAP